MRIKDFMQTKVITIPSNTSLYEARKIMLEHAIRRLPVVDNNRLVGIVTIHKIREAQPSGATTLSIHELHYLISKMTVKDIMKKEVLTCHPEDPVEDVAMIMYQKRIGGMPVMDEKNSIIGFITTEDLFRVAIIMLGLDRPVSRITMNFSKDEVCAKLDAAVALLDKNNLCVRSILRFDKDDMTCDIVIRVEAAEVNSFVDQAIKAGFKVVSYLTGKHEVKI